MPPRSFWLSAAVLVLIAACSAPPKASTRFQKNPDGIPTEPHNQDKIESTITRTVLDPVQYDSNFLNQLNQKDSSGFYEPDNCVQWVRLDKDGSTLGTFIEISAVPCFGSQQPVEEENVLIRLRVKQHPQYFTQYRLYFGHEEHEHEVGIFRRLSINGSVEYRLEGLCDISNGYWIGASADSWKSVCNIAIEASLFRAPNPFEIFQ